MTDETMPETVETTAPVEQAAPEVEQPEVETPEAEPQTPDDAGEPDKPKGGFQRRIKELADERNHWREMALRYAQQPEPVKAPEPPKAPEPVKLPQLADFQYDEAAYQAALLDFATKQAEQVVERRLSEREARDAEQRRMSTFQERQQAFAKAVPDFEDRVMRDPTLPITPAMRDVIVDSEAGPEIAYWLATNREQAEKIASLPPHLAALEMGRVEGRLQAQKEAARKPIPRVTQAPPPPPTVEEGPTEVEKSPDDMSMSEWLKWREKQLKRRK
jgi:hypothetical protein